MTLEIKEFPSTDRRLDWVSGHDSRSTAYQFGLMSTVVPESPKSWRLGAVLDQGSDGSCVGHGWTGELLASPKPFTTTSERGHEYAVELYYSAQRLDEWDGEDYEGTSVLAGAKAVQKAGGFIGNYRWCFSTDKVREAVITEGPVVIGVPFLQSMFHVPTNNLLDVSGAEAGGHCMLVYGYHPGLKVRGVDKPVRCFRIRNSWGPGWGLRGNALIRYEDLMSLLSAHGEACVAMDRKQVRF